MKMKEEKKQQANCAYCALANQNFGNTKLIFEDDDFKAVFVSQTSLGHAIIIPKEHCIIVTQVPEHIIEKMYSVVPDIIKKTSLILKTGSFTIVSNSGIQQKIAHFSLHVIPRKEEDKMGFMWERTQLTEDSIKTVKEQLTQENVKAISHSKKPEEVRDYFIRRMP